MCCENSVLARSLNACKKIRCRHCLECLTGRATTRKWGFRRASLRPHTNRADGISLRLKPNSTCLILARKLGGLYGQPLGTLGADYWGHLLQPGFCGDRGAETRRTRSFRVRSRRSLWRDARGKSLIAPRSERLVRGANHDYQAHHFGS